jgi:hypothetical protein
MWTLKWPWRRRPSPATHDARRRLEAIQADDARVDNLSHRAARILRENNLAPTIMDALGVRRR